MRVGFPVVLGVFLSAGAAAAEPVERPNSYAELVRLIQEGDGGAPLASIDALLEKIAYQPENAAGFSLVYASRSLQTASPEFPRVVFYGRQSSDYQPDTRLVLAFTTDPAKPDYQTLEVLSQDPATEEVQLAEIRFPGDAGGKPTFAVNPPRCAVCHGSPARPIWDSYPIWPGVYGSIDDFLDANTSELKDFQALLPKIGTPGRMQSLQVHTTPNVDDSTVSFSNTPNLGLTMALSQINYRRLARQVQKLPHFDAMKYALVGAANGCLRYDTKGSDWYPPALETALGFSLGDVQRRTQTDADDNDRGKLDRFFNVHGLAYTPPEPEFLTGFDTDDAPIAGSLRFAALLAGSDMRDWSMTLTPRAVSFATGGSGVADFGPVLQAATGVSGACEDLAKASLAALTPAVIRAVAANAAALRADLASDGVDRQPLALRCMSCHTVPLVDSAGRPPATPGAVPYYPFDRIGDLRAAVATDGLAARLRAAVTAGPADPRRMPKAPRAPLTTTERGAFLDFLDALAR